MQYIDYTVVVTVPSGAQMRTQVTFFMKRRGGAWLEIETDEPLQTGMTYEAVLEIPSQKTTGKLQVLKVEISRNSHWVALGVFVRERVRR